MNYKKHYKYNKIKYNSTRENTKNTATINDLNSQLEEQTKKYKKLKQKNRKISQSNYTLQQDTKRKKNKIDQLHEISLPKPRKTPSSLKYPKKSMKKTIANGLYK